MQLPGTRARLQTEGVTPPTPQQGPHLALTRHIAPVAAGAFVTIALTIVTNSWLASRGVMPPLWLAAAYRGLFIVLGSHLAARLAPDGHPRLRYALALAVLFSALDVVVALSIAGQVPGWYVALGIALPLPCAIIGGATAVRAINARTRRDVSGQAGPAQR